MSDNQVSPPFGMSPSQPAFDCATWLAETLFEVLDASIVLKDGAGLWRSRDPSGRQPSTDLGFDWVVRSGDLLWVEDCLKDARFAADANVAAGLGLRFYVGAPIRLADGSTLGVLCAVDDAPRAYDPNLAKALEKLAASVADECDRAQEAQELERAKSIVHAFVSTIPISLIMTDRQMRLLYATPRWFDSVQLSEEDCLGRCLHDISSVFLKYHGAFERGLSGEPITTEKMKTRYKGRDHWIKTELAPWRDEAGEVGGIVVAHHQITELVEAQRSADAANSAKSSFLAMMSHEVRTPLNGVLGMAQAMAFDDLSAVQRERLDVIRRSGESLLTILNDVLDLSKIEAGKLELESSEFDLTCLLNEACAAFAASAKAKGLDFAIDIAPGAEGLYVGDPTRVRQILYNLLSNALKFTESGAIKVSAARTAGGLELRVADSGIGMSPKAAQGVFASFTQADASTTRRFGGTGLGLSICQKLARLMGGDIVVESQPGSGSTFTVDLHLAWRRASPTDRQPEADAEFGLSDSGAEQPRVLAADDNEMNRLVLKTLLQQVGFDPRLVTNGAECVEAWEAEPWDVVLMNIQMPVMDGVSAAKLIRRREAEMGRSPTPIIALTANAMAHHVSEYLAAGMDDHVSKPIEAAKLLLAIEAAVSEPPQTRASAA